MRLLNASSKELELLHGRLPRYAIVSHRWGAESEEVLFTDIGEPSRAQNKGKGYDKISSACNQALRDELDYVWLDTCCIDKGNNTELTEALNSMYKWYQEAAVCYVYLHDVSDISQFAESEWFRRGWTLQELIAPQVLKFFNKDWQLLGAREELMEVITKLTSITTDVLACEEIPQNVSIAQRMFWASQRETTRVEDRAYSLLGILGISLPAIYGIGNSAFEDLQHRIILRSHDQTLFAWYHIPTPPSEDVEMADAEPPPAEPSAPPADPNTNADVPPAPAEALPTPTSPNATGLLATSPSQFLNAYEISERDFRKNFVDRIRDRSYRSQFSISNNFVHISVPIKHHEGKIWKAVLRCSLDPPSDDQAQRPLVIYLEEIEHRQYFRTHLFIPQEESDMNVDEEPKPFAGVPGSLEVLSDQEKDLDGYFLIDVDVVGRLGGTPADSQSRPAVEDPDSPSELSEAERIARLPRHPPGIKTTNIIVCGEPGVGAGRVINQILGDTIIKPLTDYERDSMTNTPIDSTLQSKNIRIFYTTGPRDPYFTVDRYHSTLKNMYQFVQDVERAEGIHFMLLCMIGSTVTSAVESNFRLFYDVVCEKQVPMALIITGLGKTTRMEDWWDAHKYDRLGLDVQILKFDHACITVLPGDTADHQEKFKDSTEAIRRLLINFIDRLDKRDPKVFRHTNVHQWFVSMGKQSMELLLSPHRKQLTEEGTAKALMAGCGLADKEARLLTGMIFLNDQEMEERIQELEQQETEEREEREAQEAKEAAEGEELKASAEGEAMEVTES